MNSLPIIAAFDLDGTLTRKDTLFEFVKFVRGKNRFHLGILWLTPILVLHKAGFISSHKAKEHFLSYFLGGIPLQELEKAAEAFTEQILVPLLRPKVLAKIQEHKTQGHELFLVTASLSLWTKPFAERNGMTLIASEGEVKKGIFTGKLSRPNNHGQEKVNRLREVLPTQYLRLYAYGDSDGDREMLEMADAPYFRFFHT